MCAVPLLAAVFALAPCWTIQDNAKAERRSARSRVVSATIYQDQALVVREVEVPEGEGTIELVVAPLPPAVVPSSLYTENADGIRVLSTRLRTRIVERDTREEVRQRVNRLRELEDEERALRDRLEAAEADVRFVEKLEGFTGSSLTSLTDRARLDAAPVLMLSRFIMETRGDRSASITDLRKQIEENKEALIQARKFVSDAEPGNLRTERDAVLVVRKERAGAGVVRLGYLVHNATWQPQYRLRAGTGDEPVQLEYLAAVSQQTGEEWTNVEIALSTARPSLDAAPPELLPLEMDLPNTPGPGVVDTDDERSRRIRAALTAVVDMPFASETPFEDVLQFLRQQTKSPSFPEGIPIYVDPAGLLEAEKTLQSPVTFGVSQVSLRTALPLILDQLDLHYHVRDGLMVIDYVAGRGHSDPRFEDEGPYGGMGGMGGGMGGMGGMGLSMEKAQAAGGAMLNATAARGQAEEMRVAERDGAATPAADGEIPAVAFTVAGKIDVPSRDDPQLLELGRVELPAEFFARSAPVLTPRVYRLARLTNTGDRVLLPGDATVYVGGEFVGRMSVPLVAAGEPFVAGFGVDPQVQVGRRLVRKTRSVQGGNQVLAYEFRIGVRNYRDEPVKLQLWDRIPKPDGETVVVQLSRTSVDLSDDAIYQRTARTDNLLRWDLDVPAHAAGDTTLYVDYEFRLEYARDLPPPQFLSGGLREQSIGGGAMGMGGMGGMMGGMGGFQSVETDAPPQR